MCSTLFAKLDMQIREFTDLFSSFVNLLIVKNMKLLGEIEIFYMHKIQMVIILSD